MRFLAVLSRLLAPVIIILGALGIAWWLLQSSAAPVNNSPGGLKPIANSAVSDRKGLKSGAENLPQVSVSAFKARVWSLPIEAQGVVRASQQVSLFTEVEGRLAEIHPGLLDGEVIKQGSVLVRLTSPHLTAQLALARSQLWQAQQKLSQATAQMSTAGEVPGLQTPEAYRKSVLDVQKTAVSAAKSELNAVLARVGRQVIKAPFTGRFSGNALTVGQALAMGSELGRFDGINELLVEVNLNRKDLDLLQRSPDSVQKIEVVIAKTSGQTQFLRGDLISKDGTLDPATGLTRFRVRVGALSKNLVPGERVAARLMFTSSSPLVRLPLGMVKGNEVTAVRLSPGRIKVSTKASGRYGEVVRHELDRVLTDRRYAYFQAKPESVLYVVPRPSRWLLPGHKVEVLLEQGA